MTAYTISFRGVMTIPAETLKAAEARLQEVINWLPYPTQVYELVCEEEFNLDKESQIWFF